MTEDQLEILRKEVGHIGDQSLLTLCLWGYCMHPEAKEIVEFEWESRKAAR